MRKGLRKFLVPLICLMLVGAAGCSKKEASMDKASGGASTGTNKSTAQAPESKGEGSVSYQDIAMEESQDKKANTSAAPEESDGGRKVIRTVKKDIETKEFDKAVNVVTERTTAEKGYIQSSNINGGKGYNSNYVENRYGEFAVRIPVDRLDNFLKDVEAIGVVTNSSQGGDDITFQYIDTETRVKTLKIQEERLLSLLQKSEKLTDVIELEKRLSEIRTEIENLTGTLKKYDNLVALATVNITIREVQEVTELKTKPDSFGEKIVTAFKDSAKALYNILKGFIIVIVTILPFAAIAAVIAVPARIAYKKYNNKKKALKKDEEK